MKFILAIHLIGLSTIAIAESLKPGSITGAISLGGVVIGCVLLMTLTLLSPFFTHSNEESGVDRSQDVQ